MLKRLRNSSAQAAAGEYLLVMFLVVGMISGMTIYFRRVLQARVHDARYEMLGIVSDRAGSVRGNFVGNLYREYEPYYANTTSTITTNLSSTTRLLSGGSSGYFQKDYNDYTRVDTFSETAPPGNAF